MAVPSCTTGQSPAGEPLPVAANPNDSAPEAAQGSDDKTSIKKQESDKLSEKVRESVFEDFFEEIFGVKPKDDALDLADKTLKEITLEAVLGPEVAAAKTIQVIDKLVEKVDDLFSREVDAPIGDLEKEKALHNFIGILLEDGSVQGHVAAIGLEALWKADLILTRALLQGIRDLIHIAAHPASAASKNLGKSGHSDP